uniref:Uncharacterized protein n=1 Tax=Rhizophora mucronata TaxID=61149 RepID=A0A2P2P4A5_RHIMU
MGSFRCYVHGTPEEFIAMTAIIYPSCFFYFGFLPYYREGTINITLTEVVEQYQSFCFWSLVFLFSCFNQGQGYLNSVLRF